MNYYFKTIKRLITWEKPSSQVKKINNEKDKRIFIGALIALAVLSN